MTKTEFQPNSENAPVDIKLETCLYTRAMAAEAFYSALKTSFDAGRPISEASLRDGWLNRMRESGAVFPDGWYTPPPYGVSVLFGSGSDVLRVNYESLRRPELNWPQAEVVLNEQEGFMYVYASPVDCHTGIIGDFGMSLYFGDRIDVKQHMKACLQLNHQIFDHVQVGITFSEIVEFAANLFQERGLSNDVTSVTDPAKVNIGHTVPVSYEDWTLQELGVLNGGDWEQAAKVISQRRKFLSIEENLVVQPGMAFTLEPRLTIVGNPTIPMSSYHTIVVVHGDGTKKLLTDFDQNFKLAGIDYMLE